MWPLVSVFSDQAEQGAPLAVLVICNILCERCNRSSPCHTHRRDCSIRRVYKKQSFEGEQGGAISRHLALGTMGNLHQAQRNEEDLCLANNFL